MKLRLALVAGACVLSISAYAHHSFPATYRMTEEVTLEGELVAFMYRNPHSLLHLRTTDENGEIRRWAIEWGGASFLTGQGITRTTFKPGDRVIVTGHPGRNPEDYRAHMMRIERLSDGLVWPKPGQISIFD